MPTHLYARQWFREPWQTAGAGRDVVAGLAAGLATPSLIVLILSAGGWHSLVWHGEAPADLLTTIVTGAIIGPVVEEVVFRYLALRGLEALAGPVVAVGATAVLFGLLHLVSPVPTPLGGIAAAAAGLMFGAAYLAHRTMWLPIALHIGWNTLTVVLVGRPDPGAHRLFFLIARGPDPLTGGAFGPDGSVFAIVACLILAGIFHTVSRRATALAV